MRLQDVLCARDNCTNKCCPTRPQPAPLQLTISCCAAQRLAAAHAAPGRKSTRRPSARARARRGAAARRRTRRRPRQPHAHAAATPRGRKSTRRPSARARARRGAAARRRTRRRTRQPHAHEHPSRAAAAANDAKMQGLMEESARAGRLAALEEPHRRLRQLACTDEAMRCAGRQVVDMSWQSSSSGRPTFCMEQPIVWYRRDDARESRQHERVRCRNASALRLRCRVPQTAVSVPAEPATEEARSCAILSGKSAIRALCNGQTWPGDNYWTQARACSSGHPVGTPQAPETRAVRLLRPSIFYLPLWRVVSSQCEPFRLGSTGTSTRAGAVHSSSHVLSVQLDADEMPTALGQEWEGARRSGQD